MPPPGAEVGDAEARDFPQAFDLLPKPGHGAGIKDLKLELAHVFRDGTRTQLHQHGKRGDLPEHHLRPATLERQFVLPVANLKVVGRQAHPLKPLHEVGAEHLALAVKGVPAEPGAFAAAE